MTIHRSPEPAVSSGVHPDGPTASIERVSETQHHRLEFWLRRAPHLPRAEELISPDGRACCWLGGAAWVAAADPTSEITYVPPGPEGEAHFRVGERCLPDQHDEPLIDAVAAYYGVDLWEIAVDPAQLPRWLGEEVAAALDEAAASRPAVWKLYAWGRDGDGWSLWALSDLGVPGWALAAITREALDLPRTVVDA
jgi:hypothetical protein